MRKKPGRGPPKALPAAAPAKGPGGKPTGPSLRGTSGPWAGKIYPLDKPVIGVGRVPPNEIVLDDDSVSRAHAEVAKVGAGYVVRDLGSANGTTVNGQPIEEHPLKPGDSIRFGVIELTYSGPAAKAEAGPGDPAAKRKKLLLAAVGVVALFVTLGVVKKILTPPEPDPSLAQQDATPTAEQAVAEREEAIARHKIRMRGYMEQNDWDRALVEADAIVALDPINLDARKAKTVAQREQGMKTLFDEAKRKKELGQDAEALERFFQIPKDSEYYRRARSEVRNLARDVLAPKLKGDCYGYHNANNYDQSYEICGRLLDYTCHSDDAPVDEKALKYRKYAEGRLKGKRPDFKEWICPSELAHWFTEEDTVFTTMVKKEIEKLYPEPAISDAMKIYALEGKPKLSYDALKRLRVNQKFNKSFALIDQLSEKLQIVDGKFTDGQTQFLQGKIVEADREWGVAIEKDKELMPANLQSHLIKEIRKSLGDGWHREGTKYRERNQWKLAAEAWKRGAERDPSNLEINGAIRNLEVQADMILSGAPDCGELKDALALTREGSPANKKAHEMFKERDCQ